MPYDTHTLPDTGCGSGTCGCATCASCTGLEALCRPRFFAGQLVTDADFRRLDDYLVGKDRLHNRFLFGTGVVCGLEVVCNPCDDTLTVHPGYALGPCGEDIVVPADTRVPVGTLIREQRKAGARRVDCGPYANPPADDCEAAEQRWILGICYDERPSRPMVALHSSACGCGGGTNGSARHGPTGCENTVTCEGFRFVVTKDTSTRPQRGRPAGALPARFAACLAALTTGLTPAPVDPSTAELVAYCCTLKAELRDIVIAGDFADCTLLERLGAISCPRADAEGAADKAADAIRQLTELAARLLRACLCSALLPPCPDDHSDDCVPLATLTMRTADLRVLDICPWGSRRFAVTLPMLGYWLSWLPLGPLLRQGMSELCCAPAEQPRYRLDDQLHVQPGPAAKGPQAGAPAGPPDLAAILQVVAQYAAGIPPLAGFDATVLASLGVTDAQGNPPASQAELDAPLAALALARFATPAVAHLGGALGATLAKAREPAAAAAGEWDDRFAALEQTVTKLQNRVTAQARTITQLRRAGGSK